MIDLVLAARLTTSPSRAAAYLAHAADEARHAKMFSAHAREWAERAGLDALPPVRADVEHLFESLGETAFLALVHRGERHGRADFEVYRAQFERRGEHKTVALFDAVLVDERRHEARSREMLLAVAGSELAARRALRFAALRATWRAWLRLGRGMGRALYAALASVLYVLAAPIALAVRIAQPARSGFVRTR